MGRLILSSYEDTLHLGHALGDFLALHPRILLLEGDLGAGKTSLVQGIARGLGIQETVTSPTFTILHSYQGGKLPLHHFDLYRLEKGNSFWEQGFGEVLEERAVIAIEWPSRLGIGLPGAVVLELRHCGEGRELLFPSSQKEEVVQFLAHYASFT